GDYTLEELIEIGRVVAHGLGMEVTPQALRKVALACQGRPRQVEHILDGMLLHFHADMDQALGPRDVQCYLEAAGIAPEGIDARQELYLQMLYEEGTAGLGTLASLLSTDQESVLTHIEPPLLRLRLVRIRRQDGRLLTPRGVERMRKR